MGVNKNSKKGCFIGCGVIIVVFMLLIIIAILADNDTKKEKEENLAKVNDTTLSINERIESATKSLFGEENNMDESRNIKVNNDTDLTTVEILADENLTTNFMATSMTNDTIELLEAIKDIDELKVLTIAWKAKFVDTYGNEFIDTALAVTINKSEIDKINFENFGPEQLKQIATSYNLHPSFE